MRISLEEVHEVATLARLALSDPEAEKLRGELEAILQYVEKVRAVDVEGVPATTHAVPMDCPLRKDEIVAGLSQDQALANAPRRAESYFAVPKIVADAAAAAGAATEGEAL